MSIEEDYFLGHEQLAELYLNGKYEKRDFDKAISVLEKGRIVDAVGCAFLLGIMYAYGVGVEKNPSKAEELMLEAFRVDGDKNSLIELISLYEEKCVKKREFYQDLLAKFRKDELPMEYYKIQYTE